MHLRHLNLYIRTYLQLTVYTGDLLIYRLEYFKYF